MKRHWDNLEGAFPLLLIGSALLVYAAIIASQEIGSKGAHLPLWGLIGGVGAVIAGAGIYSTFLEPEIPSEKISSDDTVTVPRAEWEALRSGRRGNNEGAPPPVAPPEWLEELPARVPERPAFSPRPRWSPEGAAAPAPFPSPTRPASPRTAPPAVPRAPARAGPKSRPTTPARPRRSLEELELMITELEELIGTVETSSFAAPPRTGSRWSPNCADCDRRLPDDPPPRHCPYCGRRLCPACAEASLSEDGRLQCIECRGRAAREGLGPATARRQHRSAL